MGGPAGFALFYQLPRPQLLEGVGIPRIYASGHLRGWKESAEGGRAAEAKRSCTRLNWHVSLGGSAGHRLPTNAGAKIIRSKHHRVSVEDRLLPKRS